MIGDRNPAQQERFASVAGAIGSCDGRSVAYRTYLLRLPTHDKVAGIGPLHAGTRDQQARGSVAGTSVKVGVCPEVPVTYAPPAIAWEEDYQVVHLGLTCVKFEGEEECLPGPISG